MSGRSPKSSQTTVDACCSQPGNRPAVPGEGCGSAGQAVRRDVWAAAHIGHHVCSPTIHPFVAAKATA
ncbi:hypothetical protein [Rhodococcus koreensis]|uniref:hypothetical protein n=1 Tax=Rhodococcus koreensis TaxID=99653 RepID=UPI00366E0733